MKTLLILPNQLFKKHNFEFDEIGVHNGKKLDDDIEREREILIKKPILEIYRIPKLKFENYF